LTFATHRAGRWRACHMSGAVTTQMMARHGNFDTTRAYIDVADEGMCIAAAPTALRPALQTARGRSPTEFPHRDF